MSLVQLVQVFKRFFLKLLQRLKKNILEVPSDKVPEVLLENVVEVQKNILQVLTDQVVEIQKTIPEVLSDTVAEVLSEKIQREVQEKLPEVIIDKVADVLFGKGVKVEKKVLEVLIEKVAEVQDQVLDVLKKSIFNALKFGFSEALHVASPLCFLNLLFYTFKIFFLHTTSVFNYIN